jgi:hypothetical protein
VGDPTLRDAGHETAFAARFRPFVDARVARVRAGDFELDDRRLELGATWAPSDTLSLTLAVPGLDRSVRSARGRAHRDSVGDVEARANVTAATWDRGRLTLLLGAKAPTAPVQSDAGARTLPSALQPGCSSVVPMAGVAYARTDGWWSYDASATLVMPFAVRDAPHAGDSLRVSAGAQLQPVGAIATRLGVAARVDGGGERAPDVRDPDSGGAVAYLTPAIVLSPVSDLVLSATAYVPALQAFAGAHHESTIFALSAAYDL